MSTILKFTLSLSILAGWFIAAPDGGALESHTVVVNNLNVHYVESGTGRAVVLIHGNAGGVEDGSGQIERYSDQR